MVSANGIGGKKFLVDGQGRTRVRRRRLVGRFLPESRPNFLKIFVDYLRSFVKVAPPVE
jgi:hypothetical protein